MSVLQQQQHAQTSSATAGVKQDNAHKTRKCAIVAHTYLVREPPLDHLGVGRLGAISSEVTEQEHKDPTAQPS